MASFVIWSGPNHNLMDWMRRHDEYENFKRSQSCCGSGKEGNYALHKKL